MVKECAEFDNAEEVWFWYCSCLSVRGGGLRSHNDYSGKSRPCEIGDVEIILKKMHRAGHLSNRQLRVLQCWGAYQVPPYYDHRAKNSEIRLWEEAIRNFDAYLRHQAILKG